MIEARDEGVGVGVAAAEDEVVAAPAEADHLRAPGVVRRDWRARDAREVDDAIGHAAAAGGERGLRDRAEPRGGLRGQQIDGLVGAALAVGKRAAPHVRLGLDEAERAELVARRAALCRAGRALERRPEIVRLERVLGRAAVPVHGALRRAAAAEVLGERHRVGVARALQEVAGEAVSPRTSSMLALGGSGPRLTTCTSRSAQRPGK